MVNEKARVTSTNAFRDEDQMSTYLLRITVSLEPTTKREAFNIGWNNSYCRDGHAYPPFDGELLKAFEEGIAQGKKDKEYDMSLTGYKEHLK